MGVVMIIEKLLGVDSMIKEVYIASSINYKEKCQELSKLLEDEFGITITRKWWEYYVRDNSKYNAPTNSEFYSLPMVQIIREFDFRAIRAADVVIIVNGHENYPVGSLIECGYAIAQNKIVIVFGWMRRSVMLSGCIHIESNDELVELIKRDSH